MLPETLDTLAVSVSQLYMTIIDSNHQYFVLDLLNAGHTVVFQLRSPAALDNNEEMQPFIQSGKAILIKGDALNKEQVETAWKTANEGSPVDLVLFTVGAFVSQGIYFSSTHTYTTIGGTPKFTVTKGLVISPPNLTTHSLSNVLQAIAASNPNPNLRIIAVTSTGVTKESHDALPLGMKTLYSWGLRSPHADKMGMERLLQHAIGLKWTENVEPVEEVLPSDWRKDYPEAGWLKNIVIVRPAFLTDGEAKHQYKVSSDEFSSYTISRKDMGHFIGERLPAEWETWSGKIVNVGN